MSEGPPLGIAGRLRRRALLQLADRIRHVEGRAAARLRVALFRKLGARFGEDVYIGPAVYIQGPWGLEVGDRVTIHEQCLLACQGGVTIGNDVSIAHASSILSTSHIYDRADVPIRDCGVLYDPVNIADNVWIGCGVRVLCGSRIDSGVVVGANSVVRGHIPADTLCAGAPAKVRKPRLGQHAT